MPCIIYIWQYTSSWFFKNCLHANASWLLFWLSVNNFYILMNQSWFWKYITSTCKTARIKFPFLWIKVTAQTVKMSVQSCGCNIFNTGFKCFIKVWSDYFTPLVAFHRNKTVNYNKTEGFELHNSQFA